MKHPELPRRLRIPETKRLALLARAWSRAPRPSQIAVPEPKEESVWDYPRPPAIERVDERVVVYLGDECIADSHHCLRVLETASPPTVYVPPADINTARLTRDEGGSFCEWKGHAIYYAIVSDAGSATPKAAWSYPAPFSEYSTLAGYVSFYPSLSRCLYGGERVQPQAGGFYGGWITSNLVGPFKGEPGSSGW